MQFNSKKFEGMNYGNNSLDNEYRTPDGHLIEFKESVKDLGIFFDSKLQFHCHIVALVDQGQSLAGWSLRVFKSRGVIVMLTILKSLLVSQMEYACVIWSPTSQNHINMIESVQRKYTLRFACFQEYDQSRGMLVCVASYEERLKTLGIYSLERRRERYMILYIFKIIIGLVPNPGLQWNDNNYNSRRGIRIPPKYPVSNVTWVKRARASSFFFVGPTLYNLLPRHLRELVPDPNPTKKTVLKFKTKLDKFLANFRDNPGTSANSLLNILKDNRTIMDRTSHTEGYHTN